ncbi:MAG: hypothetical protein HY726_12075, partial [Candidatus Rokubacteria bacterium]|nr:hypothetical protein [Candidatus Rokubacteria bacterium]
GLNEPPIDGRLVEAAEADLTARVISMGKCHRAFALTGAMCLAVAARIEGSVVAESVSDPLPLGEREQGGGADVRLAHPSGVLPINAQVERRAGEWWVRHVTVYRTARRLMEGFVRVPALI